KAQAKDYLRTSQARLILAPLASMLLTAFDKAGCENKLKRILSTQRQLHPQQPGYAPGNILNLLIQLQVDLHSFDFSRLVVRQAYLQGVTLPQVNFAHADLTTSVFT